MPSKQTLDRIREDFRLAEVAEGEARAFADEWLSWNEPRMLAALEAPIHCPIRGCNHEYAPIEGIQFGRFPVFGQDIEKTSVSVRCPKCKNGGETLIDGLNFRKKDHCCHGCGREARTAPLWQRRQIGLVLFRLYLEERRVLCGPCMGRYYRGMTGVTLVAGWWGIISLFVTPFVLISNTLAYLGRDKTAGQPSGPWIDQRVPPEVRAALAPHTEWAVERLNAPGRTETSMQIGEQMAARAGVVGVGRYQTPVSRLYAMLYLTEVVSERMRVLLEAEKTPA